jgi:putative ABC transport system substrate-binding protein
MRRREFIAFICGGAAWPVRAHAQQVTIPVVGFLHGESAATWQHVVAAFRDGLGEIGFVEGRNVEIAYRWAENRQDRLTELARDLTGGRTSVIVAAGGGFVHAAAKAATSTIPIVLVIGSDPVKRGLVASLSRPGGNITAVTLFTAALGLKRLELLRDLMPTSATFAVLINPRGALADHHHSEVQEAARVFAKRVEILYESDAHELEAAFQRLVELKAGGVAVGADPYFSTQREKVTTLAARHAVPAVYEWREFVEAGGLMSYGTSLLAGVYAGRVLKGEKPAELPVVQPTTFKLVINAKTAKTLGLTIPPTLLARADEVIE